MRNSLLAERISDYDALAQHLDQDYREDEESARAIQELTNTLIDLNYVADGLGDVLNWDDGFTAADVERRLLRFRETELFKQLAAMNRPVLSSDLAEFRRLANMNRMFAERTAARPDIELPRLRQFAAEFQALIQAEYR